MSSYWSEVADITFNLSYLPAIEKAEAEEAREAQALAENPPGDGPFDLDVPLDLPRGYLAGPDPRMTPEALRAHNEFPL